jgi:hypothetical protein
MGRENDASPESMLSAMSGLVSEKKMQDVTNKSGVKPGEVISNENDAPPVVTEKGESDLNIQEPVKPVKPVAPVVVKSPLGDQVFGVPAATEVKLSSFADIAAYAKDVLGEEIKDIQDFATFFPKIKEMRDAAAKFENTEKELNTYKNAINNLPPDVSLILTAALQGQDHMPIIQKLTQKAVVDFDKPFASHDTLNLINHYTGKGFTKETFDTLDPSVQEALKSVAEVKYKADQDEYGSIKSNVKSAAEVRQKTFQASVDSSIAQMMANNPKMDKASIERVRQIMTSGLASSLFTSDKTYLPDAAEKIAYLEFGKQIVAEQAKTIGDIVSQIRSQTESETIENIVMKSDKPIITGGSGNISKNVLDAEVKKATGFLNAR